MRKIGIVLTALLALFFVLTGCGDKKVQEQKISTEEVLSQTEIETDTESIPMEEIVIPHTGTNSSENGNAGVTTTTRSETVPVSTTLSPLPVSRPSATASKTTAKPSVTSKSVGVELPDHNWN